MVCTVRAVRYLLLSSGGGRGFAARAMPASIAPSRPPVAAALLRPRPRPPPPSSFPQQQRPPTFVPRSLRDAVESSPDGKERATFDDRTRPSKEVLSLWARSDVVCFDVDCTVTTDDSLDALARFLGKEEAVAALTSAAMDGSMPLEEALRRRLELLDVTPSDLARFHSAHPAEGRLTPGARELVGALTERGTRVYLISGGFRELALPVARALGVPADRLFANRMNFQLGDGPEGKGRSEGGSSGGGGSGERGSRESGGSSDGEEWGPQLRVAGFDPREEVSANGGKPAAIRRIRASLPYSLVTMVGDGVTDAEAAAVAGGADLFVGFGGVVRRPAVAAAAPWFVRSFSTLQGALATRKVAMVGSGAWACAAAKVVAGNLLTLPDFDDELVMWVHEEEVEFPPPPAPPASGNGNGNGNGDGDGNGSGATRGKKRKLSEVINEQNENVKYLPGAKLGPNVRAEPDLAEAVRGADVLLLCAPHQHAGRIVRGLVGAVDAGVGRGGGGGRPSKTVALSLIKGMRVRPEGPQLISAMVERVLGIETAVLMGANIAEEVARGGLTEATVAAASPATAELFVRLFSTDNFVVRACGDRVGVEMAGTLKNVVALAVGLATGLGAGENAKAALLRAGMGEMRDFASSFADADGFSSGGAGSGTVRAETFLEAAGISDVVASSYGGRNARVAREYALRVSSRRMPPGRETVDALEAELLAGQSLQGELTSRECSAAVERRWGAAEGARRFPLFSTVRAVFDGRVPPESVLRYRAAAAELAREAEAEAGAVAAAKEEKRGEKKKREQQQLQAREPALDS